MGASAAQFQSKFKPQSKFCPAETAKALQESFAARKMAEQHEKLPLLKRFLIKMDPANLAFDNTVGPRSAQPAQNGIYGDASGPDSFAAKIKAHLEDVQNPEHTSVHMMSSSAKEYKIVGEMMERSDARALKRIGASIAPAGFLGFGAMMGLAVTPLIGQIALGVAIIGTLASVAGLRKDEKEISSVSKMLENTRTAYAHKNHKDHFAALDAKDAQKNNPDAKNTATVKNPATDSANNGQSRSRLMSGIKI